MAKVVLIDGHKVRLPNPGAINVTLEDKTVTLHEFWPWDTELHEELGIETPAQLIEWWYTNRASIRGQLGSYAYSDMIYVFMEYTGTDSREYSKDQAIARFSRIVRDASQRPIVTVQHLHDFSGGNVTSSELFQEEREEQEEPTYQIDIRRRGGVDLILTLEQPLEDNSWYGLKNYSFKMDPTQYNFFRSVRKEDSVMFGMELEISSKVSPVELQNIVTKCEPKQDPFFICKQDSSISGCYTHKYEIVTVPCSPRYLRTQWRVLFRKLEALTKAKGKDVSDYFDTAQDLSNGLHVHVSKDHFRSDSHKKKFKALFNQWDSNTSNLINAIARRPGGFGKGSYDRIQSEYQGRTLAWRLSKRLTEDRHGTCHERSGATVEVRCFQGIFDFGHLLRCLSFLEATFEFAETMSLRSFDRRFSGAFLKFISDKRKYAAVKEALACA